MVHARWSLVLFLAGAACGGNTLGIPTDGAPASMVDAAALDLGASQPDADTADGQPATSDARPPIISSACERAMPGPTFLRLLTNAQYRRTVRDLAGLTSLATALPAENQTDGSFEDYAALQRAHPDRVLAWNKAASEIAAAMATRLGVFLSCSPEAIDDACATRFVREFGGRAHRRPLDDAEVTAYLRLYAQVSQLGVRPADAVLAVARALLQSPHFLYRIEVRGAHDNPSEFRLRLTSFEVATRLSYFFWGTMPDSELFATASRDELRDAGLVAYHAQRLLSDPRAREGVDDFFRQWLDLDRVLGLQKDAATYPAWTPALARSMSREGHLFLQHQMFEGGARLSNLLLSPETFLDAELGRLYGVAVAGADFARVNAGPHRAGMLTQGWFLAGQARADMSSPVHRGKFIRERLLCQQVPPPPPNVDPTLPVIPGATTRERHAAHIADPACAGCHALLDPLGFPFESFDGIGAWRDRENGKAVDTASVIAATDELDGPVADGLALARRLAGSKLVRSCVATRWYELSLGRPAGERDRCQLDFLDSLLKNNGGNLADLMLAIAAASSFRHRMDSEVAPPATTLPAITDPVAGRTVEKMILDLVSGQLAELRLRHRLAEDRLKFEAHLSGLRELERTLAGP